MANISENNAVDIEAAPVLCQVFFHQYEPEFSPANPTNDSGRTVPLSGAGGANVSQAPTKTSTPKSAIPTANGGR